MRTLRKNKQKMFYSVPSGTRDKYKKNPDGTIKTIEYKGKIIPESAGGYETSYSKPIEFVASISSKLNEMHAVSYGVDQSSIYSEVMVTKGMLPLKYGMKIWLHNDIEYLISEEDGEPNPDTADYTVKGIMDEFKDYDWLLLQRNDE